MSDLSSNIFRAIADHLETGVPIADHDLTPDQMKRVHVCNMLYQYWLDHPFCKPRMYLSKVAKRTPSEIVNDLKVFEFIKQQMDDYSISRDDAMHIALRYTEKMFRAADATGDTATMDRALKHWTKLNQLDKDAPPEDLAKNTAVLPAVLTTDVHHIDKNRDNASLERQYAILNKFGGKRDSHAERIDQFKQAIVEAKEVGNTITSFQTIDDTKSDEEEYELPSVFGQEHKEGTE